MDKPGARLKRGNLIFSVGVLGPSDEGVTVGFGTTLLSTAVGELAWDTGTGGAEFAGPVSTGASIGSSFTRSPFGTRLADLC